jgi:glycosyltransferase involved in cell wall biosynthesis
VEQVSVAKRKLPRVSLCLLTYKRAHALPRTLDSLLAQSHGDFELIINDDCSPDKTEEICRDYERRDSRVRYCRNKKNLRYAGNQNAAIVRASTDYVGIVHDGDVYRADMVEKWTSALVDHPNAALVFNAISVHDDQGNLEKLFEHSYAPITPGRELLREMLQQWASPIFGIVMVRRKWTMDAGPFDPRLPILADIDMWMRLLRDHDVAYIREPLFSAAPREDGHANTFRNIGVLAELELIHALNYRRFRRSTGASTASAWSVAAPLLKSRLLRMYSSARARDLSALTKLVEYAAKKPWPLALAGVPDTVLDWKSFTEHAGLNEEPEGGPSAAGVPALKN